MNDQTQYLVLSSKDSTQYFPQNSSEHFTSLLNVPLDLSARWSMGLRQIICHLETPPSRKELLLFDVYLSQVSGCILNGSESMLLRRVFAWVKKGEKSIAVHFESCDMMPIKTPYIDKIELILIPVLPQNFSFDNSRATHATLVLEKF